MTVRAPIKPSILARAMAGEVKLRQGIVAQVTGLLRAHTENRRLQVGSWLELSFELEDPAAPLCPLPSVAAPAAAYTEGV